MLSSGDLKKAQLTLTVSGNSWPKLAVVEPFFMKPYGVLMEKAMATHSSTLAWKIPWTEEPGRLQSMGLLRVGHN